ncbi:MAG: NUDIX hydrolase, partial [candidate division KSB1 bacterium]
KQFFLVNETRRISEEQSPFLWKSDTIPPAAKKGNLFHLEALLIVFISALAQGAVSVLLLPPSCWPTLFWAPGAFFLCGFLQQLSAYTVFLEEKPGKILPAATPPKTFSVLDFTQRARQVVLHEERLVLDDFFKVKKAKLQFEMFDGNLGEEVDQLSFIRGHATAILLYDEAAHEFIFIEQFRYPYFDSQRERGWMIEIVAGMVDKDESPLVAAQRETIEEIGYACEDVKPLAEFYVSPGSSAERVFVFWGKLGKRISKGGGKTSENENTRLVRMPVT